MFTSIKGLVKDKDKFSLSDQVCYLKFATCSYIEHVIRIRQKDCVNQSILLLLTNIFIVLLAAW